MNRAERRRAGKEKQKADKAYSFTLGQIAEIKKQARDDAIDTAFMLMLAIPLKVLRDSYWTKTAKKRLPLFVEQCLDLWQKYNSGDFELEDFERFLWEEGGVKVAKNRHEG